MSDSNGVYYGHPADFSVDALPRCIREVSDFVDAGGWGQPPVMFALVPTAVLAAAEPDLIDQLEDGTELTPVEQEPFPEDIGGGTPALDEFLSTTSWPAEVVGCALVQEIVVLPPTAESDLDSAVAPVVTDEHAADEIARATANAHPERREARLIAAVLRDGPSVCVLQLKPEEDDLDAEPELLTYEDLAPNLVNALYATFDAPDD